MELQRLGDWIGRTESRSDRVTAAPIAALSATLDRDDPYPLAGSGLPPLWHWLYFTPQARHSELGPDGHPTRGGFLPPVPLRRRMWAGGRLQFERPLRVGEEITRVSRIADVSVKQGRSGTLVFVTVRHEISDARGLAITEEQDLVYRDDPKSTTPAPAPQIAPTGESYARAIETDPVLLFRYSALTFNSHRIHYDRRYASEVEGYPGLVVHGPLIATLLMDLLRRNSDHLRARRFSFKILRPLFDTHPFTICGQRKGGADVELWARDHDGYLAAQAHVELAGG